MKLRPKKEIIESLKECLSIYQDALFFNEVMDKSRYKFLDKVMGTTDEIVKRNNNDSVRSSLTILIDLLTSKLDDLYSKKITIVAFNENILSDMNFKSLLQELDLDESMFRLEKNEFDSDRSDLRGPQEHAISLIGKSTVGERVKSVSRSSMLHELKLHKTAFTNYVSVRRQYGTNPRNTLNALVQIGNELYQSEKNRILDTELDIRIVPSARNQPPYIEIRSRLKQLLESIKTPTESDELLLSVHDILIGVALSIDGMVESDFCNRDTEIDKVGRAVKLKEFLKKKCDLLFSISFGRTPVQTWLSGFHFSNALHRMAWAEERMLYKILVDECSCKKRSRLKMNSIHKEVKECKCSSIKSRLSSIYEHELYANSFKPDFDFLRKEEAPLNYVRYLSNQQKHSLSRFEGILESVTGSSKEEQFDLILNGCDVLVKFYRSLSE